MRCRRRGEGDVALRGSHFVGLAFCELAFRLVVRRGVVLHCLECFVLVWQLASGVGSTLASVDLLLYFQRFLKAFFIDLCHHVRLLDIIRSIDRDKAMLLHEFQCNQWCFHQSVRKMVMNLSMKTTVLRGLDDDGGWLFGHLVCAW